MKYLSTVVLILLWFPTCFLCGTLLPSESKAEDLTVLTANERGKGAQEWLRVYFRNEAAIHFQQRKDRLKKLLSKEPKQIAKELTSLKQSFRQSLGEFPPRTPLNSRTTSRIESEEYLIEKVIFESQPGFPVTALLYLPRTKPPYPGILLPCGHAPQGKAASAYQKTALQLVHAGMAVLCFDPIGQGERLQFLKTDRDGNFTPQGMFSPTSEHMLLGVAPILTGRNLATYMIWDGMRGLDYLESRPEIDSKHLGCTGNSGGGMLTSYLMVLDDRIKSASPGCFITTNQFKNDSPGPGDAEQNIHAQITKGIDHADYLMMTFPRTVLIAAASKDFVPIQGTWESFREAKRIASRMQLSERVGLVEAHEKHGFSHPLRIAVTKWMSHWLLDRNAVLKDDSQLKIRTVKELQCTPKGQVNLLPHTKSLTEIHREYATRLKSVRERPKTTPAAVASRELQQQIRKTIGVADFQEISSPRIERRGILKRDGFQIEKLVLKTAQNRSLPALLFRPQNVTGASILHCDGNGKSKFAQNETLIAQFVQRGHLVLSVDLTGFGETAVTPWRYGSMSKFLGSNTAEYFIAYMLGQSFVGMRTVDIWSSAKALQSLEQKERPLWLNADGAATIPALHAAALHSDLFEKTRLDSTFREDLWQKVVSNPLTHSQLENCVHGALQVYDLPDLIKLISPQRLILQKEKNPSASE